MATQDITYGKLRDILDDFNHQMKASPAFTVLNHSKIQRFMQINNQRIQILINKQDQCVRQYVEHGEDGKPLTEEVDGVPLWKFKSDEAKENYLAELKEFMDLTFKVHL